MIEEKILVQNFLNRKGRERLKKPDWLKIKLGDPSNQNAVLNLIDGLDLHTVCQEARCPNIFECWTDKTATFMLGGDTCTRHCGFCAVNKGKPMDLDPMEPSNVAEAVKHLGLAHAVITSVNRDDLADGGASHFAATVHAIRDRLPSCRIEVLVPDFQGNLAAVTSVTAAPVDIFNHNVETIPRLYRRVRPGAQYARSLAVLEAAYDAGGKPLTKAGLMLGLGEEWSEIVDTLRDLRSVHCAILTLGQYLRPSADHLPMTRYYHPDEFAQLKGIALDMGFAHVESGPLVRSSYHAHEQADSYQRSRD